MENNNTQVEQVEQDTGQDTGQEVEQQVKTFTQEEVDKMLQAETDRRVNKAKAKWENEYKSKLEKEKSEAERLAKMTEAERQAEELRKIQNEFNAERESFNAERKSFEMERLKHEVVKELSAKKIPIEFSNFLLGENAEVTKANMDLFAEKWNTMLQASIEEHVNKALSGNPPKQANVESKMMTRKQFAQLPFKERQAMMNENPELVKQILQQ